MRKQTKLVAVLSAAALLAIGASMTSFAAKGWYEENGTWYYDKTGDGDLASEEWRKSGNNWFWLNADGAMVTNQLIEDGKGNYFYVDANGAMVTNRWVAIEPGEDADEDAPAHYWYRFGSSGRALKAGSSSDIAIKTVDGKKYAFDSEGKMYYGWVSEDGDKQTEENPFADADYYFGDEDDGAMHTDWLQYNDGSDLESSLTGKAYEDQSVMWFFFDLSTGKMVKAEDGASSPLKTKLVRGQRYAFDENGVMVYEWNNVTTPNNATSNNYFSSEDDGHLKKKGWVWAIPGVNINPEDNESDTYRWFYVDGSGKTYTSNIKKVGTKRYVFDENGIMKSGLVLIDETNKKKYIDSVILDDTTGSDLRDNGEYVDGDGAKKEIGGYKLYYFGDEATDGSMKTGDSLKVTFNDDDYTMGFEKSGAAKKGEDGKKIYKNGFLLTAGSDKYKAVDYGNTVYVVDAKGNRVENKAVKDADENYYAVHGKKGTAYGYDTTSHEITEYTTSITKDNKKSVNDELNGKNIVKFSYDLEFAKEMATDFAKDGKINGCVAEKESGDEYWSRDCK